MSPGKNPGVPSCPASRIHDPVLTRLIIAWPALPEPIRQAIVAIVDAVHGEPKQELTPPSR